MCVLCWSVSVFKAAKCQTLVQSHDTHTQTHTRTITTQGESSDSDQLGCEHPVWGWRAKYLFSVLGTSFEKWSQIIAEINSRYINESISSFSNVRICWFYPSHMILSWISLGGLDCRLKKIKQFELVTLKNYSGCFSIFSNYFILLIFGYKNWIFKYFTFLGLDYLLKVWGEMCFRWKC